MAARGWVWFVAAWMLLVSGYLAGRVVIMTARPRLRRAAGVDDAQFVP